MDASAGHAAITPHRHPQEALRIALLTDRRGGFENWQLALIDRILGDDRLHLGAIVVCPPKTGGSSVAFRLAASLERSTLGRQPDYIPGAPGFSDLAFKTVDALNVPEATEPDLVLSISPTDLPADTFKHLRFGSWRFSFLGEASADADWFGYEEVIAGKSATKMRIIVRRSDTESDETLAVAEFNTKFSAVRNGDFIKERAVSLAMRELVRLAETREIGTLPTTISAPARQAPGLDELLPYAVKVARNLLARAVQAARAKLGLGAPPWALFVGDGHPADFDPRNARLVKTEDDELRADPFLFRHDGQIYVFYEAYTPRDTKAHIAVGRLEGDRLERLGIALKADHHLSYPFVFRHDGGIFMIPETNKARRLEVWRCLDFPLRWELHATALEGLSSADTALFPYRGKWWLFTNLSEFHAYEDHCSELHIFEVDGPDLNRVTPHRHNPVVLGSTEARNAGRPFEHAGRLYRPSQRNEHGIYGYGLNIMEVEQLDLDGYRERCVRTIKPDFAPGLVACHHLDSAGGRYIIDAMFADQANLFR
jgi:hypothetical protein